MAKARTVQNIKSKRPRAGKLYTLVQIANPVVSPSDVRALELELLISRHTLGIVGNGLVLIKTQPKK